MIRTLCLVALLSSSAFGQATPSFEIADVHVSPYTTDNMQGGVPRNGRCELRKATMLNLIETAYGVDLDKIVGGPSWLNWDRFDVIAKAPPSTPPQTLKLMLQALLADRFKLVVHNDTRPMQAFVLSAGKGKPKLKAADGSEDAACRPQAPDGYSRVSCRNMTMEVFAAALRGPFMAGDYLPNPVVDSTGLEGSWDFDLKWTPNRMLPQAGADGITIFDAVDKQLGLKLEAQKVPMPVLVVDRANQKPTANPPGVAQSLPAISPEFEVASIRPSPPNAPPDAFFTIAGFQPGGRYEVRNAPLRFLIEQAWGFPFNDAMLAGAPKFLDTARFDIVAKASTTYGPGDGPADVDDLRSMLRVLLVDRFKLATHYEDRPLDAYTLVGAKPKRKPADPSNRTACTQGPAPASGFSGGPPPLLLTCQNITMAQFAERLQSVGGVYPHSVLDATGIEGAWDLSVPFSPPPPAAAAEAGAATRVHPRRLAQSA